MKTENLMFSFLVNFLFYSCLFIGRKSRNLQFSDHGMELQMWGEWPSGLRHCNWIRSFPVQTLLNAWWDLGTQLFTWLPVTSDLKVDETWWLAWSKAAPSIMTQWGLCGSQIADKRSKLLILVEYSDFIMSFYISAFLD